MRTVLAFDFGASSGRAIKGVFDGKSIKHSEIHRFENTPKIVDGHVCHDIDMILNEIKTAIRKAGKVDSIAFDTWGVDYALLDKDGNIIHEPYHYRDSRTANALEIAFAKMPAESIFAETGNQIMNINTLFQLLCDEDLNNADKLLFMPDLFAYLLTGEKVCEITIASTSQMFDMVKGEWSKKILDTFGIKKELFPPLKKSATINGYYNGVPVISVAGHDTQCAVVAMPTQTKNVAFLSCGTWSLMGCEVDTPIITKESTECELSNEMGANGKINFLKNISGLWLIQQLRKELRERGMSLSYDELEGMAKASEQFRSFIDPDAPDFSAHGDLIDKIKAYCKKTNQPELLTIGQIVRCIYESLVMKYRLALEQISECTNKNFEVLHLMGGGSKDGFLCELASESIGIPIIAGPIEATALGNIVLQLIALGAIKDVDEGRKIIAETEKVILFNKKRTAEWDMAYKRFCKIIS